MVCGTLARENDNVMASQELAQRVREYVPRVDIVETGDEWRLIADLPGASANNINVDYERGQLTIHAPVQRRPAVSPTNVLLTEYGVGDFRRSFQIGEAVDAERMTAEFKDGVLTLRIPKAEAAKVRKVAVTTA